MFGLGVPELIIILVVILIIFGPSMIPKMGKALGETVRALRHTSKEIEEGPDEEEKESKKRKKETKEAIEP